MLSAVRAWLRWIVAAQREASVRAYRSASRPMQWHVLAALGLFALLPTPLLLGIERQFVLPVVDGSDAALRTLRLLSSASGFVFLLVYLGRRGGPRSSRFERALALYAVSAPVLIAVGVYLVNPTGPGVVTMFVTSLMIMVLVAYQPPSQILALILVSSGTLIGGSFVLQDVASGRVATIYTTVRAMLLTVIMYVAYDRSRYLAYVNRKNLEELNDLKDTVFHALVHDLRGPMDRARRAARTLQDALKNADLPEEVATSQRDIEAATRKAGLVIDNLANVVESARPRTDEPGNVFAIGSLLTAVVEEASANASEKGVRLTIDVEDPDILADAREALAVGALRNLVDNAIKFTQPGYEVRISAEPRASVVEIRVHDAGVGMDGNTLDKVDRGERVASTPGTHGELGTGIGLLVARTFAKGLGSDLYVASRVGEGTVVGFDLPRYQVGGSRA